MPKKPYLFTIDEVKRARGASKRGPLTGLALDNGFIQWTWSEEGASGDPPSTRPHDQINYVLEGAVTFDVEGEEFSLVEGDALYIPAGMVRQGKGGPVRMVEIFGGYYWERWEFAQHQLEREYRDWTNEP